MAGSTRIRIVAALFIDDHLHVRQVLRQEGIIYMVLECGDIDLARLLARHEKGRREGAAGEIDENFIRLYWQQMLQVRPCP